MQKLPSIIRARFIRNILLKTVPGLIFHLMKKKKNHKTSWLGDFNWPAVIEEFKLF